ncbi:putative Ig domain-containing protein [Candidatus Binatia bacterium]|nr:putative Ig domain-containing protein [Candidatus Binatia bacterium]
MGWSIAVGLACLQLGIAGCSDCNLEVATTSLPNATVGLAYQFGLRSRCGGDAWFLSDGQLPPGIGLLQNGTLRGAPTAAGTYTFVVEVVDYDGWYAADTAFKGLSLTVVDAPTPQPTPSPTPTATPPPP